MNTTNYNSEQYQIFCAERRKKTLLSKQDNDVFHTPVIRTQYTYIVNPSQEFVSKMPSMTRPDMAYTPQELLIRLSKGLPLSRTTDHSYHNNYDIPDVRKLDLTEQQDILDFVKERVIQLTDTYEDKRKKRKDKARAQMAEYHALIAKHREAIQANTQP